MILAWREYLIIGLILSNVLTFSLWQYNHKRYINERTAHEETVRNFKTAQELAELQAKTIKNTLEERAKKDAQQADANYASLLAKYNASLLRFQASQSQSGGTDHSEDQTSEGSYGPSGSTEFSITLADAKICAVNTARLQAVRSWAISLND